MLLLLLLFSVFTIKIWYQLMTNRQPPSPQPVSYSLFPLNPVKDKTKDGAKKTEEPAELAFEGTVDLSDLVYIGTLVSDNVDCAGECWELLKVLRHSVSTCSH